MSSQRDAQVFARVGEPWTYIIRIGNGKRLWIDLGEEIYKGRMTASAPGYNIVGVRPRRSSFRARPLIFL